MHGKSINPNPGITLISAPDQLYEDREVVVDGNLITSREPADLPAFMRETMKQLGH
jgi:putative intracellular protease/amidase